MLILLEIQITNWLNSIAQIHDHKSGAPMYSIQAIHYSHAMLVLFVKYSKCYNNHITIENTHTTMDGVTHIPQHYKYMYKCGRTSLPCPSLQNTLYV